MGSKAGWQDVFSLGSAGAARKVARAQQSAAAANAAAQEKVAAAVTAANTAQPQAVTAAVTDPQQAAEANAYGQQKRRKTMSSTVNTAYAQDALGGNGWGMRL